MSIHDYYCYANFSELQDQLTAQFGYSETSETILALFFTIVGIAAVVGNCYALYFFIKVDREKKVKITASRIFYISFALTDLLLGTMSLWNGLVFGKGRPAYFCSQLARSPAINNIIGVVELFCLMASANIIALMSISRCVGVFFPFKYKFIFTPLLSCILLGVVLIHPVLYALLPFFFPNQPHPLSGVVSPFNYQFQMVSGQTVYYFSDITGETYSESKPKADLLNIWFSLFFRVSAIVLMVCCSVAVAVKLAMARSIGASNANKQTQRQAGLTLLVLAAVFFLTFAPFCFFLLADVVEGYLESLFYFVPACFLVNFSSSAVNPLVYHLRGRTCRGGGGGGVNRGPVGGTVHQNVDTRDTTVQMQDVETVVSRL